MKIRPILFEINSGEFDNIVQPTKILYRCVDKRYAFLYTTNFEYERDLIKFNPDTLIFALPDYNAFKGWG